MPVRRQDIEDEDGDRRPTLRLEPGAGSIEVTAA
jgi:hypothetical protein